MTVMTVATAEPQAPTVPSRADIDHALAGGDADQLTDHLESLFNEELRCQLPADLHGAGNNPQPCTITAVARVVTCPGRSLNGLLLCTQAVQDVEDFNRPELIAVCVANGLRCTSCGRYPHECVSVVPL